MKAEYQSDANAKYLVLRIQSSGLKKLISVESVGKYACDHDHWISDCGRCWDCGSKIKVSTVKKFRATTYSCLLCGTTTPLPHICPVFYPELKT